MDSHEVREAGLLAATIEAHRHIHSETIAVAAASRPALGDPFSWILRVWTGVLSPSLPGEAGGEGRGEEVLGL